MGAKRSELEYKLAQMFMVGFKGIDLEKPTKEFLEEYQPGGIIYFACNYESPVQVCELSQEVQSTRNKERMPLIISVDHEGGKVQRFRGPFTHFPEPYIFGAIDSPKLAFEAANVMAKELRAVGVNLDFHPLCDIHTRPSNPVIGKRAFGTTPEQVEKISSAFVRGFIANKMISCVKHFPGHGDTTVDSHLDLPKIKMTWQELEERELIPFQKSIRNRVDMMMTAHILNQSIDPKYPATLSHETITNGLRKRMRYNRLVITDDMQMDAVAKYYGEEDMIALAIQAGCDILLYRDLDKGQKAMEIAFRFLAEGKIAPEMIHAAYERICEVKERVLCPYEAAPVEKVSAIVGCAEHQNILSEVNARWESVQKA